MATEPDEVVDLPIRTWDLFQDMITTIPPDVGALHDEQALSGSRIGYQVDIWEHDGDAVWRITVEAVGS